MRYTEILEQLINEINMSPNILRRLASGIDARAGMEFEMIVPDIGSLDDDDYFDSEPDYEQDESISDFADIHAFFYDGEHNSRRAVDRLMEDIEGEYYDSDWLSEKKQEAWGDDAYESVKDLVDRDYADELRDQAVDEVSAKTPEFGVNGDEFEEAVLERYNELVQEKIDSILADMGSEYDEAYDEWENDKWQDIQNDSDTQREWLEHEGHTSMSDISNNYDIEWPHWTEPESQYGSGEGNAQRIADEFSEFMNKKVNFSMSYHGGRREPGAYVIEPDGSLEGDNPGDAGLEFVSPPMPINELLADLIAVKQFAETNGCYTNDSTGLHINVSVPNFSMEKLDYVKLAVLLGDERVLNEFGRMGNTYTKSALQIVKQNIKQRPEDAKALLAAMKEHLSTAAAKVIHSGVTSKYTSINTKTGYIEFRSPGGDWLGANYDIIEPTLLRFVVALDAALDETKYKQEYAKKLYKLLAPSSNEPGILELFANYSAGELDKEGLIRQVRSVQMQRDMSKGKVPAGKKYWWNVAIDGQRIEVVATSKDEAWDKATDENQEWMRFNKNQAKITPLRPYEEPQNKTLSQTDAENRMGLPDQTGDANWEIFDKRTGRRVFVMIANTEYDARRKYADWLSASRIPIETDEYGFREISTATSGDFRSTETVPREGHPNNLTPRGPGPWEIYRLSSNTPVRELSSTSRPEAEQEARNALGLRGEAPELYGVRTRSSAQPVAGSTQDLQQQRAQGGFTGAWKIMLNGREVHRFSGIGNSQADANRVAASWLRQNGMGVSGEGFEVVPIMS